MTKPHYSGSYQVRAAKVRATARANPHTQCEAIIHGVRCGKTLAQHPWTKTGKPPRWEAGHVRMGDPTSPLRPEVNVCNHSDGATAGNLRRKRPNSRDW